MLWDAVPGCLLQDDVDFSSDGECSSEEDDCTNADQDKKQVSLASLCVG